MISESQVCLTLGRLLPKGRLNDCYEADAEVLPGIAGPMLFTTDEFSAEDHFQEDDPYLLGWNIAAGAISDIYACGGSPVFYAHALTIDEHWDEPFVTAFGRGIGEVLNATGATFIGGDCGRSATWRCTVSVIGSCPTAPVLRRGAKAGDVIYMSGEIGLGNFEAALRLPKTARPSPSIARLKLPLRTRESEIVRRFASSCIDTSDGVWSALTSIADLNSVGYHISNIPLSKPAARFFRAGGLPELLLFVGECGEYELLFTVRPELEEEFRAALAKSGCTCRRLGHVTDRERSLDYHGHTLNLAIPRIEARDYATPESYLEALSGLLLSATNSANTHSLSSS
jgi:thiamine-monophosphate kinase